MITIGSHPQWHPVFEALGYAAGFAVFFRSRKRQGDVINGPQRWTVIAAACAGAVVASRLLGLAEQWPTMLTAARSGHLLGLLLLPGGNTIVGGLLGGWLTVEIVKRLNGIRSQTGDLFALPLFAGIAVGRIGCFIAGLADDTYATPTHLPWGVNFGDGIPRHPVQIYEILFLARVTADAQARTARWRKIPLLFGRVSRMASGDRLPEAAAAGGRHERDSVDVRWRAGGFVGSFSCRSSGEGQKGDGRCRNGLNALTRRRWWRFARSAWELPWGCAG